MPAEDAISAAMLGNLLGGQVCSNGTRVFIQRSLKAASGRLDERTSRIVIGIRSTVDPDGSAHIGCAYEKVLAYMAIGHRKERA